MQTRKNEIWVGVFLLLALLAALFICLRAADITSVRTEPTYRIYATFDNIGGLKARSPVRIGGVVIGRVSDITLDEKTYLPRVAMDRRALQPYPGHQFPFYPYFRPAGRTISGA